MDINAILTNNEEDVQIVRAALINVKVSLQTAAHDYAKAALGAANETLKCVQAAAPIATVWPHVVEYNELIEKAQNTLNVTTQATGMLLTAEETGDPEIDQMNAAVKVDAIDAPVIHAMIEGAVTRMNLALKGIPKGVNAPGARCNPAALVPTPPPPPSKKP